MSENEKTEETKAIEAEEAAVAIEPTYLQSLEAMKPRSDMRTRGGENVTETKETVEDEAVVEDEVEAEPDVEVEAEATPEAEAPFLTLSDGTGVTKEEAIAGYTRHLDYTQKTMDVSAKGKELELYAGIIEKMKTDQVLFEMVDKHIREGSQAPSTESKAQPMQVPDRYKDDSFVEQTVSALNELRQEVSSLKGGFGNIEQQAVEKKKNSEYEAIYNSRLQDAFNKLRGQLGTELSPDDFMNKMDKHFEGKGLAPKQYMPMIIGPDSTYFGTNVSEAYRDDIGKVVKDKVNSERSKRKPKGAEKRALKATGKPPKTVEQQSPKLPGGRLDRKAFFRQSPVQKLSEEDLG